MHIIMKYPKVEGNMLCDGSLHDIEPIKIRKFYINGCEFFYLEYWDNEFNCDSFTILRKEGRSFIKVPLKIYDNFIKKVENGEIKLEIDDLSILEGVKVIFCDEPIADIDVLYEKKFVLPETEFISPTPVALGAGGPPPPSGPTPNYLQKKFDFLYMQKELVPDKKNNTHFYQKKLSFQYYVAFDKDFFTEWKLENFSTYEFYDENYENDEKQLSFNPEFNCYRAILIDYLLKVKNKNCTFLNPICITLDLEKKCYYFGKVDQIKYPIFIKYNFGICDSKEKFNEISILQQPINIMIPEDCPYRNISRESFIAAIFRNGIGGLYTLSTYYQTFEGKLSKNGDNSFQNLDESKRIK